MGCNIFALFQFDQHIYIIINLSFQIFIDLCNAIVCIILFPYFLSSIKTIGNFYDLTQALQNSVWRKSPKVIILGLSILY